MERRGIQAEDLKLQIYEILNSRKKAITEPEKVINKVIVDPDLFIEMAHCFIAKHGE